MVITLVLDSFVSLLVLRVANPPRRSALRYAHYKTVSDLSGRVRCYPAPGHTPRAGTLVPAK